VAVNYCKLISGYGTQLFIHKVKAIAKVQVIMLSRSHSITKDQHFPHIKDSAYLEKSVIILFFIAALVFSYSSSVKAFSFAYPAPEGQDVFAFVPEAEPQYAYELSAEKPLGLGTAASGGAMLNLEYSIPSFLFPVDVYLGITGDVFGEEIYLFTKDNDVVPISTAKKDIRFMKSTLGNSYGTIFKDIPVSLLPPSEYLFLLIVTPENSFDSFVAWVTWLDVSDSDSSSTVSPATGSSGTGSSSTGSSGTGGGQAGAVAGKLLSGLGSLSSNQFSDAVQVLVSILEEGSLDTIASTLAASYPDMITQTNNGFKVDWGAGKTFSGHTVSGSMSVALGHHQSGESIYDSSRTAVQGSFDIVLKNFVYNGLSITDDTIIVSLQADATPGGDIEGVVNIPDSYSGATRGSVIFNTQECSQYPIAGYLEIDANIVNVTPGCTGKYSAGGRDMPTLTSVSPAQISPSASWSNLSTITIHGSNLWPPYDYAFADGVNSDNYFYRCHLRELNASRWDSYITDWTADSITVAFPPGEPLSGSHQVYLECPWSTGSWSDSDMVTVEVK